MQLKLLDESVFFDNNEISLQDMFHQVQDTVTRQNFVLFSMKVDGQEVFQEHFDYILSRIEIVEEVEVIVKTLQQARDEVFIAAEKLLQGGIPVLTPLADAFYTEPTSEMWDDFHQFLQGFEWLNQMFNQLEQMKLEPIHWDNYVQLFNSMNEHFIQMTKAIENLAYTEVADLFHYELIPQLKELHQQIQKTIDNEVVKDDLN